MRAGRAVRGRFFHRYRADPIDAANRADIGAMLAASRTVGSVLKTRDIVVYESTVYPGAVEEDCVPVLERVSGLNAGRDFTVGYSPERINPGDKTHRFMTITKVISGQDAATLDIIAEVYGSVIKAGVHRAPSIKVAEAAKVIENTQRDLNIAFMNGAAGFIGFHVARRLLDRGQPVVGLDIVNTYYDPKLKEARLAELGKRDGFSFVKTGSGRPCRHRDAVCRAALRVRRASCRAGRRPAYLGDASRRPNRLPNPWRCTDRPIHAFGRRGRPAGLDEPWQAAADIQHRGNVRLVQQPFPCTPCQFEGCQRNLGL